MPKMLLRRNLGNNMWLHEAYHHQSFGVCANGMTNVEVASLLVNYSNDDNPSGFVAKKMVW